jgi:hypothetical protein
MAIHTLQDIQTKVRRLTRAISEDQLSTLDLNNYINTFVVYDFPEHLRTFNLRTDFSFYCNPFQDVYPTNINNVAFLPANNPLFDFNNKYITIHPPVFIAGYEVLYSQSQEQFFSIYPKISNILSIGQVGNGAQTNFIGVINNLNFSLQAASQPILAGQVLFSSIDINNAGLSLIDQPNVPFNGSGILIDPNTLIPSGTINYLTGAFNLTFPTPPAAGAPINSQTVPYQPSLPQAMLFYDNAFTLRPVPDQPYKINFEVYVAPTDLMAAAGPLPQGQNAPRLNEWWQYIAYGAAKKVFEDRMDTDSVALITPEFRKQQVLCERRTIVQYTNERPATIYTEQVGVGNYGYGWGGGGW